MVHGFSIDISGVELPERFNDPFDYVPHPLCVEAAREVRAYLGSRAEWHDELRRGKMMGVLVVRRGDDVGFLAAFSGNLAGTNCHSYFVPPVYDLLNPDGYFRAEEAEISAINRQIDAILAADDYNLLLAQLSQIRDEADAAVAAHKELMAASKARRDAERLNPDADRDAMVRESQWQKAELRRIKAHWHERVSEAERAVGVIDGYVDELKSSRRRRSAALQHWMFSRFVMLNAKGEKRDLCEIFADTPQGEPPAGAGECAAPKLLQYAYKNNLEPMAMAEFWCGESPHGVVRHDGCFYPACKGKCLPILSFMLQGLAVERMTVSGGSACKDVKVLYDDEYIVAVSKPAGMLCVPGKSGEVSLLDIVRRMLPAADGPMVVHRLDMDTSGIVLFAKDKCTHKLMQRMFALRQVHKRYVALLGGVPREPKGEISLPLSPDYEHRPQQKVCYDGGKCAVTRYEVIDVADDGLVCRVALFPLTGRTHQLRVHCAHKDGLNVPIVGDRLYGRHCVAARNGRMCLHAERVEFRHPITLAEVVIEDSCEF